MNDAGCGSGTLRRKIPVLFGENSLKTVCFDSFILKQALEIASPGPPSPRLT